jgi:hypothetical protein
VRGRKFALRSVDARRHLDTFLVCAVAAVLGNRVFLIITGYPQLGNGTLHISHAIWGGVMMVVAIVVAIAFLPPLTRGFVAFLGGAGFGWFIDELGKFITRDVNYFFQPTIALIYVTFVVMYLVFRSIQARSYTPDEAVLNGLEALKAASIGSLNDTRRRAAIALIEETKATGTIPEQIVALLRNAPALPPRTPTALEGFGARMRTRYGRWTERRWFTRVVSSLLVFLAVATILAAVGLALDASQVRGFAEWASVISSFVSGVFYVVGAVMLRRSRLIAYTWFDRGLLVDILVTQVFQFAQEQLAGVTGFVVTITLWIMVRSAIRAERERESIGAEEREESAGQEGQHGQEGQEGLVEQPIR